MKPLNKKERSKAFIKVVGLFLISFVIAIFLGFTTMNTPRLSDSNTKGELEKLKNQLKFQEEIFAPNVAELKVMLSRIPNYKDEGQNIEVLNQDIGSILSQTKNQVTKDDTWETQMYNDVVEVLSELQIAYNEKIKMMDELGDSNEISQKLQDCINERNRLQTQVNMLQAGGGGDSSDSNSQKLQKDLKDLQQKLNQCNLENRALKQEIEKIRNR